jgi:hypothetical protein
MRIDSRCCDRQFIADRLGLQTMSKQHEYRKLLVRQTFGLTEHFKLAVRQKRAKGFGTVVRI